MDTKGKMYLVLFGVMLVIAGVVSLYTLIKNYLRDRKAEKRKVVFKSRNGQTRGFWKTKRGEMYDKDLKLED